MRGEPLAPGPVRYTLRRTDGRLVDLLLEQRELEGAEGCRVVLTSFVRAGESRPEVGLAEHLVEMSATLVSAHSESAVRRVTCETLSRLGFECRFLPFDGGALVTADGGALPEDLALGLEALAEERPTFGGAGAGELSHVYLPLVSAQPEVLRMTGAGLSIALSPVLSLFAKVVAASLSDARLLASVERSKWEMEAVADVARFVAQPVPPAPEAFLARIAGPLSADAVALHLPEAATGDYVLLAEYCLDADERVALERERSGQGLTAAAAAKEGGVLSEALGEAERARALGARFRTGAAVRLTRGGQVRGVLQALRGQERPFGPDDLRLMGTFADLLVALLEQRRLRSESARQLSDTRLLLDLARTTSGTLETASILDVAADFLVKLLDVSNCFILLYDEKANVLRGAAASAAHREGFRDVEMPLGAPSVAARAGRERRPVAVEDVSRARGQVNEALVQRFGEKAVLAVPLTSREELIGVVVVDDVRAPRAFTPALIELAEATCGQLALSIANARLYESLWASYAELAATRAEMVKRERLAALGELSAIVAHEVRNPLGVIFNAVSSLRRLLQPQGDAAMLLDILAEESDRLNRMVGDLLDYTRPRDPVLQPEDLARVLQDSLDAACQQSPGMAERNVVIAQEVEAGLPHVPMDRRLIRQALVNVAVNALQSMPHGGRLQVRASREQRDGQPLLRIDVADEGPGIPAELLHRVFEPFFTTKAQGTGLGLAVVKRILDEHHGEIAVDSAPGRGTTFTFRLPLAASEAAGEASIPLPREAP